MPPRARIGTYDTAFQVIGAQCQAIILRGLDVAGLHRRYETPESPGSLALLHLLERIDDYAKIRDEHVLVIADEVGEQAKHRSDLAVYRAKGTWGYRARPLTQIIDTLHFGPSHASRLLQAADLVAFLYRRMETHTEPSEKAAHANELIWSRIEQKVRHRHCWLPETSLVVDARRPRTVAGPKAGSGLRNP